MPTATPTRPEDRVPLQSKLAYGAAGMVDNFSSQVPTQLATPIYVTTLGLSPVALSLALLVWRLYDAVSDPIMGWISDNTRSRWGRRKPYLVVGALLVGLLFPLLWFPSREWSPAMLTAWLVGGGVLFYTAFTIWAMPYQSMLLEMTPDYHERTRVSSFRAFFQQISSLIGGWVWYLVQLPLFTDSATGQVDPLLGAQALSITAGLLVMGIGMLPVFFVKERHYPAASSARKVTLRDNFRWTLSNRPFLLIGLFTLFFACGSMLSGGLGFYLRLYYVTGGDQAFAAKIQGVESTLFALLGFASIPFFNWLCQRVGKTGALLFALGLGFLCMSTKWFTYTPDHPWLSVVNGVLLAPVFTGIWQIIPSINGDVVDHDELATGERREGAFASIYSWIVKASFSLGAGLSGPIVVWCGFDAALGTAQPASAFVALRLCYALLPACLLGLGLLVLLRYPLSPVRMAAIRAELEARRGNV